MHGPCGSKLAPTDPTQAPTTIAAAATTVLGTGLSIASQMQQANAQAGMAGYQAQVARNNQMVAEWNARRALQQGRVDEQQQRHGCERAEPAGQNCERRDQREHVAVEVRVEGEQAREVRDHERGEHEIGPAPAGCGEREHETDRGDEQRGAERVPEGADEREPGPGVIFEAQPAFVGQPLDAPRVSDGLARMDGDVRDVVRVVFADAIHQVL